MPIALIYWQAPLSPSLYFITWYHTLLFAIAATCLFVPLANYARHYLVYLYRKRRARPVIVQVEKSAGTLHSLETIRSTPFWPSRSELEERLQAAANDYVFYCGRNEQNLKGLSKVGIVALTYDAPKRLIEACSHDAVLLARCNLFKLNESRDRTEQEEEEDLEKKSNSRNNRVALDFVELIQRRWINKNFHGVLLPLSDILDNPSWITLCHHLASLNLLVFLEIKPDYKNLQGIDLGLCDGLVIRNAAILPTGDRRDFFKGFELRDVLGRCTRQKAQRPHFTAILHDPSLPPSVPILRRAYKFAKFHEVILASCGRDTARLRSALPRKEPYSAFDWLKRPDVLELHRNWLDAKVDLEIFPRANVLDLDLDKLEHDFPSIGATFFHADEPWPDMGPTSTLPPPEWTVGAPVRASFFTTGRRGQELATEACFELREEVEPCHVEAVLRSQRHMRDLKLAQEITILQKQVVFEHLGDIANNQVAASLMQAEEFRLFQRLVSGIKAGSVVIMEGLDTGFSMPNNRFHLWGVSEQVGDVLFIHVSLKAKDLAAVVLHTYMLSQGLDRRRAFEVEMVLEIARTGKTELPPRVLDELRSATKSELVEYLQQIRLSADSTSGFLGVVIDEVERLLLDGTTRQAWRKLHGEEFLAGRATPRILYDARLDIWRQQGLSHPLNVDALVYMHKIVDERISRALHDCDAGMIDNLTEMLANAFRQGSVALEADLLALMVFCAFRRIAVEETYVAATDRCPIFHFQRDQPGVFSELWVIGSQCEVYFDVVPSVLGAIHYDKYRAYLKSDPPPRDAWDGINVFTAYHKVENPSQEGTLAGDAAPIDPFAEKSISRFPRLQKFAFLSIFCVPAALDVLMLALIGRGLFQTAYMTDEEVTFATLGLLASLLLCSGTIGWIGASGGYYLYNAAFDSMLHLMTQKLSGAVALTLAVGVLAWLGIGLQAGWYAGFIFFMYLMAITTYFNILGILATMHRDGSPFPSGRTILWQTVPMLLLSPIITIFVHEHDVLIYLIVIYVFVVILYLRFRRLSTAWSQWYAGIETLTDAQVTKWYRDNAATEKEEANDADYETCRQALAWAVEQERRKSSKHASPLIKKLAFGREYARWLLKKDLAPGADVPLPYSSAWNNQLKMGLTTYENFVRGLKEHSGFLQFRYARAEIGWNVCVFISALLDRWVSVTMSAAGNGPINLFAKRDNRYSIALALFYFLSSAVALDFQCQFCWAALAAASTDVLESASALESTEQRSKARRSALFWRTLRGLLAMMSIFFGIACFILFFWVGGGEQLILFFAYSAAYTFVLLEQYVRVFIPETSTAFKLLATAITIGYLSGVVLHLIPAIYDWIYIDVIVLGGTAALGTVLLLIAADLRSAEPKKVYSPQEFMERTGWKTHSQKHIGLRPLSDSKLQAAMKDLPWPDVEKASVILDLNKYTAVVNSVTRAISSLNADPRVATVFPNHVWLLRDIRKRWLEGTTNVYMVDQETFRKLKLPVSALARHKGETLEVFVAVTLLNDNWLESSAGIVGPIIAEALVHETCECIHGMPHWRSVLAETMMSSGLKLSRCAPQFNSASLEDVEHCVLATGAEIASRVCLRIDLEHEWNDLPEELRQFVVQRIVGCETVVTGRVHSWLAKRLPSCTAEQAIAAYDLSIALAWEVDGLARNSLARISERRPEEPLPMTRHFGGLVHAKSLARRFFDGLYSLVKYVAIVSVGDPDVPREFVWSTRGSSFRYVGRFILLSVWQACRLLRVLVVEFTLIHSRPEVSDILGLCRNGIERRITRNRVINLDPDSPSTGFMTEQSRAGSEMAIEVYDGVRETPGSADQRTAICYYDELERLVEMKKLGKAGKTTAHYLYRYDTDANRIPYVRETIRPQHALAYYDDNGRICRGTRQIDGAEWTYEYVYAADGRSRTVRKALYSTGAGHKIQTATIFWCITPGATVDVPDDDEVARWSPTLKVTRYIWSTAKEEWDLIYTYRHKRDPAIHCTYRDLTSGETIGTDTMPPWMSSDKTGFTQRPVRQDFAQEDLLFVLPALSSTWQRFKHRFSWAGTRRGFQPLSTGEKRTLLWRRWHKSRSLDGVICCFLDEQILRDEAVLKPYWQMRDSGMLKSATSYLRKHIDEVAAAIDIVDDVSQNTFLPMKLGDLFTMGQGGTSNYKTRTLEDNLADSYDRLSIAFLDTGCFPDQPGGVSNCRRDLVNGHTTIRNHVFTESASDFGIPRYQVERNVQSIKVLPMWGLDYLSPYHGLFDNLLDSQVAYREEHTTQSDIKRFFVPILQTLVRGARSLSYTSADLERYTQAFVDLSMYFEEKDYLKSWASKHTKRAWREAWLADQENAVTINEYMAIELPSAAHFDEAMELWRRYFFVFSVRIPEEVPTVFQCTHHGVASLFGMLLKLRRGTAYQIWDHAIYWRESCLNISSSQCILPLSVQNMLLGAIRLSSHLAYTHADVVLPCTNLFNPEWEKDIGSGLGRRMDRNVFGRKIDPVVNGISDMERFEPVDKLGSDRPTVMMLSNVQFIKDVKNAVYSADIIVNRFGFKKYRLVIYGALDRTPQYTAETEAIIRKRNLEDNVILAGFGNPKEILKDAWAFMNSSLSEGLPLAIGEAALSGAPIIATDVGATALVISDPIDPKTRYGEIVPPNDSLALARAQIQILSMLGPWTKYTGDSPPPLPEVFTSNDVDWITQRMYDKTPERRALGLKGRETVLHSFNGNRYLREHEQMYWLGSYRSKHRRDPLLTPSDIALVKLGELTDMDLDLRLPESKLWSQKPWRYFDDRGGIIHKIVTKLSGSKKEAVVTTRSIASSTASHGTSDTEDISLRYMPAAHRADRALLARQQQLFQPNLQRPSASSNSSSARGTNLAFDRARAKIAMPQVSDAVYKAYATQHMQQLRHASRGGATDSVSDHDDSSAEYRGGSVSADATNGGSYTRRWSASMDITEEDDDLNEESDGIDAYLDYTDYYANDENQDSYDQAYELTTTELSSPWQGPSHWQQH
ncbi:hypothetical protein PYCC9005_003088 [Savitreella phatthalungensis]